MGSWLVTNSGEDRSDRIQKRGLLPLFVKNVLLESRGRPADYRRRDAAHNFGADLQEL